MKTRFEYDPLGRVLKTTHPDGRYRKIQYDTYSYKHSNADGSLPSLTYPRVQVWEESCFDSGSLTPCIRSIDVFDTRGNKIRSYLKDADGSDVGASGQWRRTYHQFDLLNRLTRIIDPIGATYIYAYDFAGNKVTSDDPGLGKWTMIYDQRNLLTKQIDAKGQQIRFTYDRLGRQTRKDVLRANGSRESRTTWTYDDATSGHANIGFLTRVSRGGHVIGYDYHNAGQIKFERHTLDGRTFTLERFYRNGVLSNLKLPNQPGSQGTALVGSFDYDAAGRLTSLGNNIKSVTYNLRGQPVKTVYKDGQAETRAYNNQRGWLSKIEVKNGAGSLRSYTFYYRNHDGRVNRIHTNEGRGRQLFRYDYAGRLVKAIANHSTADSQTFTYDAGGRMRSNSWIGSYSYSSSQPVHAPSEVDGQAFTYDANGNMTKGLDGRIMTYDAENRPLSVSYNGVTTSYVYSADGSRLKQTTSGSGQPTTTTAYFGLVEIQNWGQGSKEEVITYPYDGLRLVNGALEVMYRDQLGSIRKILNGNSEEIKNATYAPFGTIDERVSSAGLATAEETKGFIGERFDAGAGLQYLNARYYDPELASFIPADPSGGAGPHPTVQ